MMDEINREIEGIVSKKLIAIVLQVSIHWTWDDLGLSFKKKKIVAHLGGLNKQPGSDPVTTIGVSMDAFENGKR